mgnify:CR=1 FL=1
MTAEDKKIDQRVFDLYDEYCHGKIDRREFLSRSATIMIGGVSALWMQLGIVHDQAALLAKAAGIEVVMDRCTAIEHRRLVWEGKLNTNR